MVRFFLRSVYIVIILRFVLSAVVSRVKYLMMTRRFRSKKKGKLQTDCDPTIGIFFQEKATDFYISNDIVKGLFIKENQTRV